MAIVIHENKQSTMASDLEAGLNHSRKIHSSITAMIPDKYMYRKIISYSSFFGSTISFQ